MLWKRRLSPMVPALLMPVNLLPTLESQSLVYLGWTWNILFNVILWTSCKDVLIVSADCFLVNCAMTATSTQGHLCKFWLFSFLLCFSFLYLCLLDQISSTIFKIRWNWLKLQGFLWSAIFLKVNDKFILVSITYYLDTWKSGVEVVYSAAYDLGNSRQTYIFRLSP